MPILKIHKNALYVNNELVKFQFEIDTVLVLDSQVIVLIKLHMTLIIMIMFTQLIFMVKLLGR